MSDKLVTYDTMKTALMDRHAQWSGLLKALMPPQHFLDYALVHFAEHSRLGDCTETSLLVGIYKAARDSLELGKDCYLVPFKNQHTGRLEAVYVHDYRGIVKLLERTGNVTKAFSEVVFEHDVCTIDYGHPIQPLVHQIALRQRGKALGCYGAIVMRDKTMHLHYMTHEDIDRVRQQAPGRDQDAWIKHPLEMWRKTALKNAAKYCPLTPALHEALTQEEAGEPAPVGAARARELVGEMFDRSAGTPEEEA